MNDIKRLRQEDVNRLAHLLGDDYDKAKYIMNCFYRLAGLYSRLCIVENDAEMYETWTRYGWLEKEEDRQERMTANINKHLSPIGLRVNLESACTSIVRPDEDKRGCIAEIFTLGHWYR